MKHFIYLKFLFFFIPFILFADFSITSEIHTQGIPHACFNGNKFLVTWKDLRRNDYFYYDIFGQFVSPSGFLIDSNFPIVNNQRAIPYYGAILAFDGTKYLVVWHDCYQGHALLGRFVTTGGDTLGLPFFVSTNHGDVGQQQSIAFSTSNYLVVWTGLEGDDAYVVGQLVSQSGSLVGSEIAIAMQDSIEYHTPSVTWDGNNYLVVYVKQQFTSNICGQFVSPDGINIGQKFQISSFPSPVTLSAPLLAWDGNNYLVVWSDTRDGMSKIYGQLVSPDGTLIGQNFLISLLSPVEWGSVAWNGTHFLVVFECNGDIYGQFVSYNGTTIGSNFSICSAIGTQRYPITSSNGDKFLVVWEDSRNGNWDIYGEIENEPAVEEISHFNSIKLMKVYPTYLTNYIHIPQTECNIYNSSGKFIIKVKNGYWDGKDKNGSIISSGIYIIKPKNSNTLMYKVIKIK